MKRIELKAGDCQPVVLHVRLNKDLVAKNVQISLLWNDGTEYLISADENGKPKLSELSEFECNVVVKPTDNAENETSEKSDEADDNKVDDETSEKSDEADDNKVNDETSEKPDYMPEGFKYFDGAINTNDYRITDENGNIFTWIPETQLDYGKIVKGFFVSTYEISKGDDGNPKSVEGKMPWGVTMVEAIEQAKKFGGRILESEEYDAICAYCAKFIGSSAVYEDSTNIGNYKNSDGTHKLEKTGKYLVCGVSSLAGNSWTWINREVNRRGILRGGSCAQEGKKYPMGSSMSYDPNKRTSTTGFRIVL